MEWLYISFTTFILDTALYLSYKAYKILTLLYKITSRKTAQMDEQIKGVVGDQVEGGEERDKGIVNISDGATVTILWGRDQISCDLKRSMALDETCFM